MRTIFTKQEMVILNLIAKGYNNMEIAKTLIISVRTVQNHINNMHQKSDVRSTVELLSYAIRNNFIQIKQNADYNSEITDNVIGYKKKQKVNSLLQKIKQQLDIANKANKKAISFLKNLS
jgi:DNA-binding CsgD family transcriptional regulator